MLSARVYDSGVPGLEFDHLLLRVELEQPYIADVGFGDSFIEPLPLHSNAISRQRSSTFRLIDHSEGKIL